MNNKPTLTLDCIHHLLGHFSLQELIRLRVVCKLWNSAIEHVFFQQKSLTLFGSRNDIQTFARIVFEDNLAINRDFVLNKRTTLILVSSSFCDLVAKLFPNIQTCTIFRGTLSASSVGYLLHKWSSQLESFTFFYPSPPPSN